jgi:hypothetical protein
VPIRSRGRSVRDGLVVAEALGDGAGGRVGAAAAKAEIIYGALGGGGGAEGAEDEVGELLGGFGGAPDGGGGGGRGEDAVFRADYATGLEAALVEGDVGEDAQRWTWPSSITDMVEQKGPVSGCCGIGRYTQPSSPSATGGPTDRPHPGDTLRFGCQSLGYDSGSPGPLAAPSAPPAVLNFPAGLMVPNSQFPPP